MTRSVPTLRAALRVGAVVALLATSAWATSNLNLSKSNINRLQNLGKLVTATADVQGDVPAVVYTTVANADFVLTQVCAGPVNGGIILGMEVQNTARPAAFVVGGSCLTFNPGMIVPAGKALSCVPSFDFEAATFCTIMGLQSPAPTPRP